MALFRLRYPATQDTDKPKIRPVSEPESLHSCPFLKISWASFEQIVVGLRVKLCSLRMKFQIGFVFFLCVRRYLKTITEKSEHVLCETLLLGHAQVRCARIGRSRVKDIKMSSENRNHRQSMT